MLILNLMMCRDLLISEFYQCFISNNTSLFYYSMPKETKKRKRNPASKQKSVEKVTQKYEKKKKANRVTFSDNHIVFDFEKPSPDDSLHDQTKSEPTEKTYCQKDLGVNTYPCYLSLKRPRRLLRFDDETELQEYLLLMEKHDEIVEKLKALRRTFFENQFQASKEEIIERRRQELMKRQREFQKEKEEMDALYS